MNTSPEVGTGAVLPARVCYQQINGRDTISVRLEASGASVTGELDIHPAEKDRARGPFRGTRKGDQLLVEWQRMGEGTTQVHEIAFTLSKGSIRWLEGTRTFHKDKWVLANPTQGYEYALEETDCPPGM